MNRIKTLIFDYAGVMTPTPGFFKFAERSEQKLKLPREEIYFILREYWSEARIGKISSLKYWQLAAKRLGLSPQVLRQEVIKTFPLEKRMLRLLRKLHTKYTTVLLSNQIEDWLGEVIVKNKLNTIFHHVVTSFETGYAKPDKRIFEITLNRAGCNFNNTILIDDQKKNVDVVRRMGVKAILFRNSSQLLKRFDQFGVKYD